MKANIEYPELTKRQELILAAVLERYTEKATAVGSNFLSRNSNIPVSSATIRNEMAELERMGLLAQPHTSAGRIPTEMGYMYYVDSIMDPVELPFSDRIAIIEAIENSLNGDFKDMLKKISIALSRVSTLFSVILLPELSEGILLKIDLNRIASGRLLVVLSLKSGLVKSIIMEIDSDIRDRDILPVNNLLNERLSGLKLSEVRDTISERLSDTTEDINQVLVKFMIDSAQLLFDQDSVEIHFGETRHLMDQPEFTDHNLIKGFFELLENQKEIVGLFKSAIHEPSEGIRIAIGQELGSNNISGCSVVTSKYSIGSIQSNIGVIGPTRMNYARLTSLINFTTATLQNRLVG